MERLSDHPWVELFWQDDDAKVCGLGVSEDMERGREWLHARGRGGVSGVLNKDQTK